MLEATTWMSEQ